MPTSLQHLLSSPYSLTAYAIVALLLLAFLLLAYRDLALLFVSRRPRGIGVSPIKLSPGATGLSPINNPAPSLSPGLPRIWAVARTAIFEAWAGRVWALPLLWFAACFIINLFVSPYDEQDRIAIYLRVFLTAQELLALIFLGILAAFSFPVESLWVERPKERERRTIINTASKPLSRLEYFLGKALGFSATAAALLLNHGPHHLGLHLRRRPPRPRPRSRRSPPRAIPRLILPHRPTQATFQIWNVRSTAPALLPVRIIPRTHKKTIRNSCVCIHI